MTKVSIPALYDGEHVHLLEDAPTSTPYHVLVTFIEPATDATATEDAAWLSSFGAWQDDRPVEATLRDIEEARTSRAEPPYDLSARFRYMYPLASRK